MLGSMFSICYSSFTSFHHLECVFSVLQLNELVVGDTSGKLLVYKNDDSKPWITRSCVGMVSEMKRFGGEKNASDTFILKYVHSFKSCVCAPADLCGCRGRLQQRKGASSLQHHIVCIRSKTPRTLFVSVVCPNRTTWSPWVPRAGSTSLI